VKRSPRSTRPDPTALQEQIIAVVEGLGIGEVVSFGDVAARAGRPDAARAAGTVLANSGDTLPWWRVVYADGHLPPCNPGLQESRLTEEGVELRGYRVIRSPAGRFAEG
jgi:methylated-DNA-protein-cysteine methyltransferase-like protein